MKSASVIGYLGMVGGMLGLLATRRLLAATPLLVGAQAAAVGLMVWARVTFGRRSFHAVANPTEGGLVTTGPYRYIRHPIYTAVCLFAGAGVAAHGSWLSACCGLAVLAGAVLRMLAEEVLVAERYPAYLAYKARTSRMIPYLF